MTRRVELTIDELVLDGFDEPADAVGAIRDELTRRLGSSLPEQLGGRLGPVAAEVANATERGSTR